MFPKPIPIWITFILLGIFSSVTRPVHGARAGCEYWVAPPRLGDDSHSGSVSEPWATLEYAAENAADDYCTIWFLDGVYTGEHRLSRRFDTPTTFRALHSYRAILEQDDSTVNINGGRNLIFEGFVFRHTGPGAGDIVVSVHSDDGEVWAEEIVFRNNIFHDSYNNDLLKLYNGVRSSTVEGNVFYNQGPNEQQIDVNSVDDVIIRDNIFFNDYAGSGREEPDDTKHFIIIKDSGGERDNQLGSRQVTVEANIFLSWEGDGSFFVKVGNDSKPFHEGIDIRVVNNLFVGNATDSAAAAFGASGGKEIHFVNNTVVGDLPSTAYAFSLTTKGKNPENEDIYFLNNIWSDPTGTMGEGRETDEPLFSTGTPEETDNLVLASNLYWNGDATIPDGTQVAPREDDPRAIVADPLLPAPDELVLPRWDGSRFDSGNRTIREEFIRLAHQYAVLPATSPAIGQADPAAAPSRDLLGRQRTATPDIGAYEYQPVLSAVRAGDGIRLEWTDPREPEASAITLTFTSGGQTDSVQLPVTAQSHVWEELTAFSIYGVQMSVQNADGDTLASSNRLFTFPGQL